ncbi:unnamed protein product [Arctia plantaginis]|uniref:BLOC-1-related complex subunit 6 C-terminal helix domain-containing protein n=1 Tax=Arctia plantaginis TaxID=874455 RepID=A0A8S0ZR34_ARCPL|nr:unnamed protein product [Arctia plantaginis]CAB3234283.1 unnamed protein product [Arctia plantaginis]
MAKNLQQSSPLGEQKDILNDVSKQNDIDGDEEISARMTASYSEISFHSDQGQTEGPDRVPGPSRPYDLPSENRKQEKLPLDMDGHVSSSASRSSTPSGKLYRQILAPQIGQIDITVLHDLEYEAQRIAQSVDNLIENLSSILHSNSSLTAENMEVYKDAVGKTCDAMDNNIKSMYTILAKGEEVSQAMIPVQAQAARIAEIKRLLQIFENNF